MKQPYAPADLKKPGKGLWREVVRRYDVEGCEPLLGELCRLFSRLHEVRERLGMEGLTLTEGEGARIRTRKHPLIDAEPKLSAAFVKTWKTLGLDKEMEPPKHRGRPGGS